jgi:hypothetical protein
MNDRLTGDTPFSNPSGGSKQAFVVLTMRESRCFVIRDDSAVRELIA